MKTGFRVLILFLALTAALCPVNGYAKTAERSWTVAGSLKELDGILAGRLKKTAVTLDVPELLQYPELPTGCESVALTADLMYLGCELEKTTIAGEYLRHDDNIAIGYSGDPFSYSGSGIFPPGLMLTALDYIVDNDLEISIRNTSGKKLRDLFKVLQAGYPVIVWGTMYNGSVMYSHETFFCADEEYHWYANEHCMVLCGYDLAGGTVTVSDPLAGITTYDLAVFEKRFDETGAYSLALLSDGTRLPHG